MIRHAACTALEADTARRAAVRRLAVAWVTLLTVAVVGCGGQAGAGDVPTSLDTPEITRVETIGTWVSEPAWEEAALGPDEPPAANARWDGFWVVPADYFEVEWTAVRGADAYALYLDGELLSVIEFAEDRNPSLSKPRAEFPREGELTVVAIVWADPESVVPTDDVNADFQLISEPSAPVALPEPCDARVHEPTDPQEIPWCLNRSAG